MSVIINIDHETGNLTQWTGTGGGDNLSVTTAAALAGTGNGLSILVDDTTDDWMYQSVTANTSGKVRIRFYIDPNSMTIPASSDHIIASLRNSAGTAVALIYLSRYSSAYKIQTKLYNDAGSTQATSLYTITDAPHCVEVYLQRATGSTANNGSIELLLDGASQETVSGVDNYDRFNNFGYLYFGYYTQTSSSGTLYLDEIIVNDDGGQIGGLWVQKFTGASTPTGTLDGEYTPSGATETDMTLTGASTPTGTLSYLKALLRTFTGGITPQGPITYTFSNAKTLTGASTPTGTLARVLNIVRTMTGAVTSAGTAVKQLGRTLTGAVTSSGTLSRVINAVRTFSGELTSAGAYVGNKVTAGITYMTMTGTVALAGVQTRVLNLARTVVGAITPAGTAIKQLQRKLTGASTPTGTLAGLKAIVRAFTGAVTMAGTLARRLALSRIFTGAVTMAGALSRALALNRIFTGAVNFIGTLAAVMGIRTNPAIRTDTPGWNNRTDIPAAVDRTDE